MLGIQERLVDVDWTVRRIDTFAAELSQKSSVDVARECDQFAADLGAKLWALWEIVAEAADHPHDVLGMVPAWLGPDSVDGGFGLLIERTTAPQQIFSASDRVGVWAAVTEELIHSSVGWVREELPKEWLNLLSGVAATTSSPRRPCGRIEPTGQTPRPAATQHLGEVQPEAAGPAGADDRDAFAARVVLEVVFPVVHETTTHGLLIAMELDSAAVVADVLAPEFVGSTERGRDQAIALAIELGVSQEVAGRWSEITPTRVRGVPPGYRIKDASAGAPTALTILGAILGLPSTDLMVTGALSASGALVSSPDDVVREKASAAELAGFTLLDVATGATLGDIAPLTWPVEWLAARARAALDGIQALGVTARVITDVDVEYTTDGVEISRVETPALQRLRQCVRAGNHAMIVSGKASSGRTTDARRIALEWADSRSGVAVEVRTLGGRLPDHHDLARICELVCPALGVHAADGKYPPTAVILEDLIQYEGSVDLDAALIPVTNSGLLIVAVCLYWGGSGWSCEQVVNAPTPRSNAQLTAFAQAFLVVNGLSCSDEVVAVCQHEADGDLWLFVNMLARVAVRSEVQWGQDFAAARVASPVHSPPRTASAEPVPGWTGLVRPAELAEVVLREFANRTLHGLNGEELAEARAIAASSLLNIGVPETMLTRLDSMKLRRLGGARDYRGRWRIMRGVTCRGLLHGTDERRNESTDGEPRWRQVAERQYKVLESFLAPLAANPEDTTLRFAAALMTAAKTVEWRLHRQLVNLFTDMFVKHLGRMSPPATIAFALLSGGRSFDYVARRDLFATLLTALKAQGWEGLSLRDVTVCLHAIRVHRDLPEDRREQDAGVLLADFRDVLDNLHTQVRPALMRCRPSQGTIFIHELGLFFDEPTSRELVTLAGLATQRCNPKSMEDHQAAVRLTDHALKYGWERPHQTMETMRRAAGIVRLLEHPLHTDAGLLMAQAAVRLQLGTGPDVEADWRRLGVDIGHNLQRSLPWLVAEGLTLLQQVDKWAAAVTVNAGRFDDWLRRWVWSEDARVAPWVTNMLVRSLTRTNVQVLFAALYRVEGSPSEEVMTSMQASITAIGDLKGVGHVLGAVAAADNLFGPGGMGGFTSCLTMRLLPLIDHSLSAESRSSVVLHTMTALVAADLPADKLRGLLDRCASVVGAEARDNDKDGPARLALLLAQHSEVATEFLDLLQIEITDDLLLRRISESPSMAARGAYLELACALNRAADSAFVARFVEARWLQTSLRKLQDTDALTALQALQAYAQFLRETDAQFEMRGLLDLVQPHGDWAPRLRRLHTPGQMSQALNLLRRMSRTTADKAVTELDALSTPGRWLTPQRNADKMRAAGHRSDGSSQSRAAAATPATLARAHRYRSVASPGLTQLVQRHFVHPLQAIDLVNSVYKVNPARARGIGRELIAHGTWNARVRATLDAESAGQVGQGLLQMSRSGMWLTPRQLDMVKKQWMFQGGRVRSVFAAETMMRGLVAADRDSSAMAEEWAARLNVYAIGNRIARGAMSDLENTASLIDSLAIWGPEWSAIRIARCVPMDSTARLAPAKAHRLLQAIHRIDPVLAKEHISSAGDVLVLRATQTFVVNRNRQWLALGWFALRVREISPQFTTPPVALDAATVIPESGTRAWTVAAMGGDIDPGWLHSPIEERSLWSNSARLSRLVMASRAGMSDVMGRGDTATEVAAVLRHAGPSWRAELLSSAASDTALESALTPAIRAEIAEEAAEDLMLGRVDAALVRERLFALA